MISLWSRQDEKCYSSCIPTHFFGSSKNFPNFEIHYNLLKSKNKHLQISLDYVHKWILINSINKICDGWKRDLGLISAYTKNQLVYWSDNKELSLRTNVIS